MCYAGGVTAPVSTSPEIGQVYEFLRAALRQVTQERPYRGPRRFQEGAYIYTDESQGELERFWGVEAITHKDTLVYQLRYSGGLLR